MVADIDKNKIRNVVRKTCIDRRKISLLKVVKISKRLEEKLIKLVDTGAANLWGHFKDHVLNSCDEACHKKGRRKGDTIW